VNKVFESGFDLTVYVAEVLEYLRKLLLIKAQVGEELVEATEEQYKVLEEQAGNFSSEYISHMVEEFQKAKEGIKDASIVILPLEVAIIKLVGVSPARDQSSDSRPTNPQGDSTADEVNSPSESPSVKGQVNSENRISDIEGKWSMILGKIRPYNHSVEALLRSVRPIFFDGENLIIESYYAFHKERLDMNKNREVLETVLKEVVGNRVLVKCILGKKVVEDESSGETSFRGGLSDRNIREVAEDDSISRKAVEVFSSDFDLAG